MTGRPPIHLHVAAPAAVKWVLCIGTGLFGLFFIVGAVDRWSPSRIGESLALLAVGIGIVLVALRTWRYYRQPALSLVDGILVRRPFWRLIQRWKVADIAGLALELKTVTHSNGRRLPMPVTVEYLTIRIHAGGETRFVLPAFAGGNAELLAALSAEAGVPITSATPT
ncbi:MAG: hypothetical protein AAGK00_11350 [Pseudomonadota bacterium]